ENPFLGWRGIRFTLDHPDIFLIQLRAMLRASQGNDNLSILLPMISNVQELDDALRLFEQAYQEVSEFCRLKRPTIGV
ncbi:putative PEP-binding protein, partial [Vibrio campbellii]